MAREGLALVGILAAVITGIVLAANGCDSQKCNTIGSESGRSVRHDIVNGCRIEHKGRYVPVESWKNLENE